MNRFCECKKNAISDGKKTRFRATSLVRADV